MATSAESAPPLSRHTIRYALTQLDYNLRPGDVPALRRFVNLFVGAGNDLFHNHRSERSYHYRYPLVQYKSLDRKAVLLGLSDPGVAALEQLLQHPDFRAHCIEWIGEHFAATEVVTDELLLEAGRMHRYRLRQYIALNRNNLQTWQERPALSARAALLERCLTAHVLKFCSAIRWQLPPKSLQVELLDFQSRPTRAFDNPFTAFEVVFQANLTLPDFTGLGKAVSHGFGVLEKA
jgi:hypothetical protein